MMYCLVRFVQDNIYHVCQKKAVQGKFAKWIDGHHYKAQKLANSGNRAMLQNISSNLNKGVPFVHLQRIDFISCKRTLSTGGDKRINIIHDEIIKIADESPIESILSSDNEEDPFETDEDSSYVPSDSSENGNSGVDFFHVQSNLLGDSKTDVDSFNSPLDSSKDNDTGGELKEYNGANEKMRNDLGGELQEYNGANEKMRNDLGGELKEYNGANEKMRNDLGGELQEYNGANEKMRNDLGGELQEYNGANEKMRNDLGGELQEYNGANEKMRNDLGGELQEYNGANEKMRNDLVSQQDSTYRHNKKKTKQHCCFVCQKLVTKLPKHFLIHKNVEEVEKVLSLPKGSSERRSRLYDLQKRGDFDYNAGNDGNQMITVRLKATPNIHRVSVPCPYCKGYYSSNNLRNHIRLKCNPNREQKRNLKVLSRCLQPKILEKANDIMKHSIFPKFRDDSVTNVIRYDELIIIFGNMMCVKYSTSSHHHKMIRSKLRHLGKVLQMAKSLNSEISDMASLFDPKNFDTVTKAIQDMAGMNHSKGEYRAPSSATTSCTLLLQVGEMCKFEAIKSGDTEREKKVDKFIFLLQKSMNPLINKIAIENRTQRQRQKLVILPKTEDISGFFSFLCNEVKDSVKKLNKNFDLKIWEHLAKCTLTLVLIFNRKRPGEIERAQLLDYQNFEIIDEDRKKSLGHEEKELAKVFGRFRIRGKLNRNVPVVISNIMKSGLDTMLKFRTPASVPEKNKYLFGRCDPNGLAVDITFSAYSALTELKTNIPEAKHITATKLRKHLATVSNELNLGDRGLENVTDFMGHNTSIHKNIYRQIPVVRDIVDVAPVLNTAVGISGHEAHLIENDSTTAERNSNLSEESCSTDSEKRYPSKRKRVMTTASIPRRSWTTPEKKIMKGVINQEISNESTTAERYSNLFEESCSTDSEKRYPSKRKSVMTTASIPRRSWTTPEKKIMKGVINQEISNESTTAERYSNLFEESCSTEAMDSEKRYPSKRKRVMTTASIPRRSWTTPEKKIMKEVFDQEISNKQVPTLMECTDAIMRHKDLETRTPKQLQTWVLSENNRNTQLLKGKKKNRWTTPERKACRKYFHEFYETKIYPTDAEIQQVIENVPELRNRTPRRTKSHLQHDIKYVSNERWSL